MVVHGVGQDVVWQRDRANDCPREWCSGCSCAASLRPNAASAGGCSLCLGTTDWGLRLLKGGRGASVGKLRSVRCRSTTRFVSRIVESCVFLNLMSHPNNRYHHLKPGSATIAQVASTAAGVAGWAERTAAPETSLMIMPESSKEYAPPPSLLWTMFGHGIGLELMHCLEDGSHAVRLEAAYVAIPSTRV